MYLTALGFEHSLMIFQYRYLPHTLAFVYMQVQQNGEPHEFFSYDVDVLHPANNI